MSRKIWNFLLAEIKNEFGVAGLMGNMQAESGLVANNLENRGNNKLGMTDQQYTAAVDSGAYSKEQFIRDGCGYGLVQHTYWSRKQELYEYIKTKGVSIADEAAQLEFIVKELRRDFKTVWNTLCAAKSVREASDIVLNKFEMPSDLGAERNAKRAIDRAAMGQSFYDQYAAGYVDEDLENLDPKDNEDINDSKELEVDMEKYIIYCVANGDSLAKVAARYGTTVEAILELNPELLGEGTQIKVPVTQTYFRYQVASGDNLSKLAKRHGTTVDAIVGANGIKDPNALEIGQILFVPIN